MSGNLGTIPYPLIDQQWQDVPGTNWQQPSLPIYTAASDQSPGWFMPQAMGAAAVNPATGQPYLDLSPPPLPADWGSPAAAPAPATPQIAEHPPDQNPQVVIGPDGKPTGTATVQTTQPPPPAKQDTQQKPAAKQPDVWAPFHDWVTMMQRPLPPSRIDTSQPPPAPPFAVPPPPPAYTTSPLGQQIRMAPQLGSQTSSGYSTEHEEHERTAQRYRDMLGA